MRSMTMYFSIRRRSSFASGVYRCTYCCSSRLSLRLNIRAWSRLRRRRTWSIRRRCSSLRRSSSRSSSRSASIWVRCSWTGVMIGSSAISEPSVAAWRRMLVAVGEAGDARALGGAHILIAEDEPEVSDLLSEQLHAHGFTTEVAEDGVHALARAESNEFDLLVLDLGLPGKDGLSVLRELRARGQTMPVVILT